MDKVVLISIPETSLRNLIEQAVKNAISDLDGPVSKDDIPQILNFSEACKYIDISQSHGYKLTSSNQIPHSKRGKRLYFDKIELDKWLLGNKVKTNEQISREAEQYINSKRTK